MMEFVVQVVQATVFFGCLSYVSTKFYHEEAKVEISDLHEANTRLHARLKHTTDASDVLQETVTKLQDEMEGQDVLIIDLSLENVTYQDDTKDLRKRLIEQNLKFQRAKIELGDLLERFQQSNVEIGNLQESNGRHVDEIQKLLTEKEDQMICIDELRFDIKFLKEEKRTLLEEKNNLREELRTLLAKVEILQAKFESKRSEFEAWTMNKLKVGSLAIWESQEEDAIDQCICLVEQMTTPALGAMDSTAGFGTPTASTTTDFGNLAAALEPTNGPTEAVAETTTATASTPNETTAVAVTATPNDEPDVTAVIANDESTF